MFQMLQRVAKSCILRDGCILEVYISIILLRIGILYCCSKFYSLVDFFFDMTSQI